MINFTATDPLLHEDMLHCHCLQEAFARDHQNQHTQTGVVTLPTLPVKSAIQPLTWQEMDIQHQSLSSALTRTWTVLYLTGTISLHGKTITVNRVKACIDGEEFSGGIPGRVRTAPHFAPIFKYPATDVGHDPEITCTHHFHRNLASIRQKLSHKLLDVVTFPNISHPHRNATYALRHSRDSFHDPYHVRAYDTSICDVWNDIHWSWTMLSCNLYPKRHSRGCQIFLRRGRV